MAYNVAARKYHGEDAKQNHIPPLDYYLLEGETH